jgi:hypothetical protein
MFSPNPSHLTARSACPIKLTPNSCLLPICFVHCTHTFQDTKEPLVKLESRLARRSNAGMNTRGTRRNRAHTCCEREISLAGDQLSIYTEGAFRSTLFYSTFSSVSPNGNLDFHKIPQEFRAINIINRGSFLATVCHPFYRYPAHRSSPSSSGYVACPSLRQPAPGSFDNPSGIAPIRLDTHESTVFTAM